MKLCTDILYQNLSQSMHVERSGKSINELVLDPPVFWCEGMQYQNGMTYVGRAGEFPEPPRNTPCLLICVGGRFPAFRSTNSCCVFSIASETNLFKVFNLLQSVFIKFDAWKDALDTISHTTADIGEMLRITAPLLGHSLAVCNKHLELIAHSSPDGTILPSTGIPLSKDRVAKFADSHATNIAMRNLFVYTLDGIDTYCLNIFTQDSYQGLLTMSADGASVTPGKIVLFQFFFHYIREAVKQRIKKGSSTAITLKSIFNDLINCMPVSNSRISKALSGDHQEMESWICMVAKPTKSMENIPSEYFCTQIEDELPKSVAIFQDPYVVIFLPGKAKITDADTNLQQTLSRFLGNIGVSNPFRNLLDARFYYRQAVIALDTATDFSEKPMFCYFKDYAFSYALHNSIGELAPQYIIPQELLSLKEEDLRENDYSRWNTLRVYLDNEMNATQTSKDLFIHRTTLQNRLKNIENLIDLSTSQKRMYIRYGIYLMELLDITAK